MPRNKGIGGHTLSGKGRTDDWITPPDLIKGLGRFDLDPCQSLTQPWLCAKKGYTVHDDGLAQEWKGLVYCNAPYSNVWAFMKKLAEHREGVGLLFGRTETRMFREHIWQEADAVLFLAGRLTFYKPDGKRGQGNSGGPSVLVAYGRTAVKRLKESGFAGALVTGWELQNMDQETRRW